MLLLILSLVVCVVVLLRRDKIAGAALGPSQRLIGSTVIAFIVLALTPTKWTHHFGAFAALGAGMAALAALATSSDVLRSRRNRVLFLAALSTVLALAFTGPNAWWYTNNWGVPDAGNQPYWDTWALSTLFMGLTAILLIVALAEHLRGCLADGRARRIRRRHPRRPRWPSAPCSPRRGKRSDGCGRRAAARRSSAAPARCGSDPCPSRSPAPA